MKAEFLNNEIWILTFGGGFQRANIYKEKKVTTEVRKKFRQALRDQIEKLVEDQYHKTVTEEKHLENIHSLVFFSRNTKFGVAPIEINFGVAQKLLNLYLKYSWCIGKLKKVPVHFPVDRLIQGKLNEEAKDSGIPKIKLKAWTQFEDEEDYQKVIEFAETVRAKNYPDKSLAEMELEIFTRR
ncbi:MAG: hypothetical protein ABJ092_12920 [Gillisia sp.]